MRVTVEIDERLLSETMELAGAWTPRAAIELALRELLLSLQYQRVAGTLASEAGHDLKQAESRPE